jgi:hypothetical protein
MAQKTTKKQYTKMIGTERKTFGKWFWKISGYKWMYLAILICIGLSFVHNSLLGLLWAIGVGVAGTIGVFIDWKKLNKIWDEQDKRKEANNN